MKKYCVFSSLLTILSIRYFAKVFAPMFAFSNIFVYIIPYLLVLEEIMKRLSLSVSLLVLAVSLVLAFIAISISTRIVTKNNTEGMIIQAEIGASLLEARIKDRFSMLQELANTSQVQSMNRKVQSAFFCPACRP
jgi:predicted PurR-regulated permease PerM